MTIVKWRKPSENGHSNNPVIFNAPLSGLFENFFGDDFFTKEYASFVPAINVAEDEKQYNLELSAPGFDKDELKIEVDKGILSISGKHKTEKESKEKTFTRKEFNYGSFQRQVTLPEDVNQDAIEAKYENGILKIVVSKKEEDKNKATKEISIS